MRRVTVFRIDDKSKVLEYPLARLQNFSSDPRCLILKEGGQEFTFGTRVGAEVCGILKDVRPKAPICLSLPKPLVACTVCNVGGRGAEAPIAEA